MKHVDLPTAKVLQTLGYDGEYAKTHIDTSNLVTDKATDLKIFAEIPAPRLDDAAYFLRDKHRISIEPMYSSELHGWDFTAYDMDDKGVDQLYEVYGNDYEDTLEAAVAKAIEIIKNEKQ